MVVADFLYEIGALKRVARSGWWLINIKNPESVAEHSFRAGVVGYILAKMEGADTGKVALMSLFNDLHESRVNDLHKVGHRYIDFRSAETKASAEQCELLGEIGADIHKMHKEFNEQKSKEAVIARDADLIECLAQAREYQHQGYKDAQNWIDNTLPLLASESAKRVAKELIETDPNEWSFKLKNIQR